MKVIILMAGHSRRFKKAGYATPKPFIDINGKTMIERVCQMFSPKDEFIFICNKNHLLNKNYRKLLDSIVHIYHIVAIDPHEYGPVYSSLQAEEYITDNNAPIIISYCDFTMQWNYKQFLLKAAQCEGAIPVFRGFHPASLGNTHYAYLKANEHMEMIELKEKQSFTNNRVEEFASTGVYYFESWKTFKHYANELLKRKETVASEYYCSLIYNSMVRDNNRICLFEVEKFICWGTPEDLQEYLFWSDYFAKDLNQIQSDSIRRG